MYSQVNSAKNPYYLIYQEIRKVKNTQKIPLGMTAKCSPNRRQLNAHMNLGLQPKKNIFQLFRKYLCNLSYKAFHLLGFI